MNVKPLPASNFYRSEYCNGSSLQSLLNDLDAQGYAIDRDPGCGIFPEFKMIGENTMYTVVAWNKSAESI